MNIQGIVKLSLRTICHHPARSVAQYSPKYHLLCIVLGTRRPVLGDMQFQRNPFWTVAPRTIAANKDSATAHMEYEKSKSIN
jgi:hypothetical protein